MEPTKTKDNLRILLIFMVLIALTVAVKLVYVHFFDARTELLSKNVEPKIVKRKGKRGNILASDGKALAITSGDYGLYVDFRAPGIKKSFFYENVDSLALCLSRFFGDKSRARYASDLRKAYKRKSSFYHLGNRNVDQAEFYMVKEFPFLRAGRFKSGFIPQENSTRTYPLGFNLGRTIGRLSKAETDKFAMRTGLYGLEEAYEKELSGKEGTFLTIKVPYSKTYQAIEAPEPGRDIVTTLDTKFQDYTEQALSRKLLQSKADWGTAIVMDVTNGDIKSIANLEYNNGKIREGKQNYALGNSGCLEPGSTFKTISLMIALETGQIDSSSIVATGNGIWKYARNSIIRDSNWKKGGNGDITVAQVLEKSSNVGTAKVIDDLFKKKEEDFVDQIDHLLLNKPFDLKIKGMASPIIPHPQDNTERWSGTSMAWMSYGYGLQISPLHTLAFYAAIANNGVMMAPRLVKGITDDDGDFEEFKPRIRVPKICTTETLGKLQEMLVGVIENGTGRNLKSNYYSIAGKTGTTQIFDQKQGYLRNKHNASFVGYFPAENPKYAVMVMVGNPRTAGHYGGTVAGPVFADIANMIYAQDPEIHQWKWTNEKKSFFHLPVAKLKGKQEDLERIYSELEIPFESETQEEWVKQTTSKTQLELHSNPMTPRIMPDVIGMGMSDAIFILENAGYHVNIKGRGKVKEQSPKKGKKLSKGANIYLRLG